MKRIIGFMLIALGVIFTTDVYGDIGTLSENSIEIVNDADINASAEIVLVDICTDFELAQEVALNPQSWFSFKTIGNEFNLNNPDYNITYVDNLYNGITKPQEDKVYKYYYVENEIYDVYDLNFDMFFSHKPIYRYRC